MKIFKYLIGEGGLLLSIIVTAILLGTVIGSVIGINSVQVKAIEKGFAHYEVSKNRKISFVWHTNIFLELKP